MSTEWIKWALTAVADLAGSVAKLAVVKLLNGVVFPLASLLFLIWLVRSTLYPALGLDHKSLYLRDFAALRAWVLAKTSEGSQQGKHAV